MFKTRTLTDRRGISYITEHQLQPTGEYT